MGSKKANESVKARRKIVRTTIEVKKETLQKHENGVYVSDLYHSQDQGSNKKY